MVLMNVIVHVIIHGSTSIIKPKVIYHKKSVDLVTGNFLLQVVPLLGGLSSNIRFVPAYTYRTSGCFVAIRNTP